MTTFRDYGDSSGKYYSDEEHLKDIKRITEDFRKEYGKEMADQYFNSEMRSLDSYHKELEKLKDPKHKPLKSRLLGEAGWVALSEQSRRKMTSLFAFVFEERFKKKTDPNYESKGHLGLGRDLLDKASLHCEEKMNLLIDVVIEERIKKKK